MTLVLEVEAVVVVVAAAAAAVCWLTVRGEVEDLRAFRER